MRAALAIALTALVGLAACGGSDEEETATLPEVAPPEQPALGLPAAERTRDCLTELGFDVVGGRRDADDRDAPDVELSIFAGTPIFIAFYEDPARAGELEPKLRAEARRLGGDYELRGGVGVLFAGDQPPAHREPIADCAFG